MASQPPVPMRVTMVKPRVGVCKRTTRDLPAASHVYGYTPPSDPEGAGERKYVIFESNSSVISSQT